MTSLLDNIDGTVTEDAEEVTEQTKCDGLWCNVNKFRKEHPIMFYALLISVVIILVVAVILIIRRIRKGGDQKDDQKKDSGGEQKETFYAANEVTDEFDYINKYLKASMGDFTDFSKIVVDKIA